MLFSATLDAGVQVLVKRFLDHPVTHEADSEQSPVAAMDHHVLHLAREHRVPVLVEVVLERVTNISMGVEINNVVEFEELALTSADAPTAIISMLD